MLPLGMAGMQGLGGIASLLPAGAAAAAAAAANSRKRDHDDDIKPELYNKVQRGEHEHSYQAFFLNEICDFSFL